ncbi:unnamed protein product [Lymnaea stagnalis]|uniref:Cyclic nucleotide-binding domain-containing protein n=1 Tax=Lymnaea stagnalis TaxID=6523 RepID=A0AAV2H946_LYMST
MNRNILLKLACLSLFIFAVVEFLILKHYTNNVKSLTVDSVKTIDHSPIFRALKNVTYFSSEKNKAVEKCNPDTSADRQRLYRDILNGISDAKAGRMDIDPGDLPNTAHYVWCGSKLFLYENYLSVLSIVRVYRPMKIVFHFNQLPTEKKLYNSWFQELRQSLPYLVLRQTSSVLRCNSSDSLSFGLEQLASSIGGGIYFGERAILTYVPRKWKQESYLTYLTHGTNSSDEVIVFARYGLVDQKVTLEKFKENISYVSYECFSVEKFNDVMTQLILLKPNEISDVLSPCLIAPKQLYPEKIINNTMPFGEVARNLHYGTSKSMAAQPGKDPNDLIPAICHVISLNPQPGQPVVWTFQHYLSVLSALYVGGFHRVFVHGDIPPTGEWWDKMQGENVTFVFMDNMETIYQQKATVLAHQSDALRALILLKYGGAYQDKDVLWANPVPEHIRRYPALMTYDWPWYDEWPRGINMGVIMAKPGSMFLRKLLDSYWFYNDSSWEYNGILMPYKVYETYPESVLIYGQLQIICYYEICHPAWHEDYIRKYRDAGKPTGKFSMDEPHAFHFTVPKLHKLLTSFATIKNGTCIAAQVGQRLMAAVERAGKQHLLVEAT